MRKPLRHVGLVVGVCAAILLAYAMTVGLMTLVLRPAHVTISTSIGRVAILAVQGHIQRIRVRKQDNTLIFFPPPNTDLVWTAFTDDHKQLVGYTSNRHELLQTLSLFGVKNIQALVSGP